MSIPLLIMWQMIATFYRTWIYNNTDGSIFTAIMFHATGNTVGYIIPYNLLNILWLTRTKFVTPFLIITHIAIIMALILVYGTETMTRKTTKTNVDPSIR